MPMLKIKDDIPKEEVWEIELERPSSDSDDINIRINGKLVAWITSSGNLILDSLVSGGLHSIFELKTRMSSL